jgi:hypothetical protein
MSVRGDTTSKVQIYDVNGRAAMIMKKSRIAHCVVLSLECGEKITVAAEDLKLAIRRATTVRRHEPMDTREGRRDDAE